MDDRRDGRLWIVQSRPITVASTAPAARGALARTRRPSCWSNANVNENFPQPITPLLYSIARTGYYHYFRNLARAFGLSRRRVAAMEQPLRHIIGVHGARMYYNLTSIHGILRSAPFGELLAAWFNQFVGSEDTTRRRSRRALDAASRYDVARKLRARGDRGEDDLAVPVRHPTRGAIRTDGDGFRGPHASAAARRRGVAA